MFEQLKIKVAVRQSMIWGVVLVMALFIVSTYNIVNMYREIDRKLTEIADMPYYSFFDGEINNSIGEKNRDTMAIFVTKDGNVIPSNDLYEEETVKQIVNAVFDDSGEVEGYLLVGDNRVAYKCTQTTMVDAVYLCDYTEEYEYILKTMLITIVAGSVGIIAIALISVSWSKRNVAPVEDAFNKQQELVANASHELKTPITIINTDLSILNGSADNLTDEQKKWLDNIGNQVNRMSRLVGEMLLLARLEANGKNQLREEVNLSTVTEGVVLESEALAFEKNVSFTTSIQEDVKISAVAANIEKLVYILVENALKYTPRDGTVTVTVTAERKRASLSVRNTGDGIKKDDIPKLFDRFYRVDESHSTPTGFGLGLAIAKSIVDSCGGTIGVDSKEGEYTEFLVVFKQLN